MRSNIKSHDDDELRELQLITIILGFTRKQPFLFGLEIKLPPKVLFRKRFGRFGTI